jgi:hypothetical protein
VHSNSWGGHVWIALVLAVAAAMLSDPRRGAAYQEMNVMLVSIEPTADELAEAIADAPQLVVPP